MTFALAMLLLLYAARKGGWFVSRRVLYRESGVLLVLSCVAWGLAMAWLLRLSINALEPGTLNRWILGYALGAYIAIPNFGLVLETTIPDAHLPRHRAISNFPVIAYALASVALARLDPPVSRQLSGHVAAASPREASQTPSRSVANFLFGMEALSRADARPSGIDADSNVRRVAAIFREAIDSAAFVDRAELNSVYSGLGDHFLDEAVRHMDTIVHIETTHTDTVMNQAMASIVAWQRSWNANRSAARVAIASRYSS